MFTPFCDPTDSCFACPERADRSVPPRRTLRQDLDRESHIGLQSPGTEGRLRARKEAYVLVNLYDFEAEAGKVLDPKVFDYYRGGARDELTLVDNRRAFDRIRIRHRVLRGIGERDLSTTVQGTPIDLPVLVAPMALQRMAHPEGEGGTAKGVAAAGTIMCVSTMATMSLEEVQAASPAPKWFQVYIYKDRSVTLDMVERAKAVGYDALILTVDTPIVGMRERDVRNQFSMPDGLRFANFEKYGLEDMGVRGHGSQLARYSQDQFETALRWEDVTWLAETAGLPVWVKGLVHPEDAELAVQAGVGGIVVSNHGARQLDTSIATIDALPDVVAAVRGRVEVLVDGGVRRGTDIIKAVALGARAVLLGRPILYGLALEGQAGVERILGILRDELDIDMALAGFRTIDEIRTLGPGALTQLHT